MTEYVTTNATQRPIPVVRADDTLVYEVRAYCARLRERAAALRKAADECEALADRSDPIPMAFVPAGEHHDGVPGYFGSDNGGPTYPPPSP